MIAAMEQMVTISFTLSADLLVGLGHAARAAGQTPAEHLRALLRDSLADAGVPAHRQDEPAEADDVAARVLRLLAAGEPAPAPAVADAVAVTSADDELIGLVRRVCADQPAAPHPDGGEAWPGQECVPHAGDPVDPWAPAEDGVAGDDQPLLWLDVADHLPAETLPEQVDDPATGRLPGAFSAPAAVSLPIVTAPAIALPAAALPAGASVPLAAAASDIARIMLGSTGWLDLQRRLRREGLVLRLSANGRSLDLHSWPADRPLAPVETLGLTLEALCLHYRAPFPGGGGLSHVLRMLIAEEQGPHRAA